MPVFAFCGFPRSLPHTPLRSACFLCLSFWTKCTRILFSCPPTHPPASPPSPPTPEGTRGVPTRKSISVVFFFFKVLVSFYSFEGSTFRVSCLRFWISRQLNRTIIFRLIFSHSSCLPLFLKGYLLVSPFEVMLPHFCPLSLCQPSFFYPFSTLFSPPPFAVAIGFFHSSELKVVPISPHNALGFFGSHLLYSPPKTDWSQKKPQLLSPQLS